MLRCVTLRNVILRYITLRYITLHYITLTLTPPPTPAHTPHTRTLMGAYVDQKYLRIESQLVEIVFLNYLQLVAN